MQQSIRFSRQELYDLVWSAPMSKLALTYAISDRGLSKLCERHDIPVPTSGYWLMREDRKPEHKPKLKPLKKGEPDVPIFLAPRTDNKIPDKRVQEWTERERQESSRIVVAPSTDVTPAVAALRRVKKKDWIKEKGLIQFQPKDGFDLRVSEAALERVLTLVNSLIAALASRGIQVGVSSPAEHWRKPETCATVLGQQVALSVQERLKINKGDENSFQSFSPSGRLAIEIDERADGIKKRWEDTEGARIEECLNEVVISMVKVAVVKEASAAAAAVEKQAAAERQEKAAAEARLQLMEKARRTWIQRQVEEWLLGHDVAAFVAAGRLLLEHEDLAEERRAVLAEWFNWAEKHSLVGGTGIDPRASRRSFAHVDHGSRVGRHVFDVGSGSEYNQKAVASKSEVVSQSLALLTRRPNEAMDRTLFV